MGIWDVWELVGEYCLLTKIILIRVLTIFNADIHSSYDTYTVI